MKSTTTHTTSTTLSKNYESLKVLEIKRVLEKRKIKYVSNSKKEILIQMLIDNDGTSSANNNNNSKSSGKTIKKRKQDNDQIEEEEGEEEGDQVKEEEENNDETFLISSQLKEMEIDDHIKEIAMEDAGGSDSGSRSRKVSGGSNGKSKKCINKNKKLKKVVEPYVVDFQKLFFRVFRSIVIRSEISKQLALLCKYYKVTFSDAIDTAFHDNRTYLNTIIFKSTESLMVLPVGNRFFNSLIPFSVQSVKVEKGGVALLSKLSFPSSVNTLIIADYKMEELHLPLSITNLTIGNTNSKFEYELNYVPPNVINLTIAFEATINFHSIKNSNLKSITFPDNYSSSVKSIPDSVDKLILKKFDKRKISKKYYQFILEINN